MTSEEIYFLPREDLACCYDCVDECVVAGLGLSWNVLRWFYNPWPRSQRISLLTVTKDKRGDSIYVCRKHAIKRGLTPHGEILA